MTESVDPAESLATRALLARLGRLADLHLDLHGLEELVDMWRTQVDRAVEDNEELEDYIRGIEMQMDAENAEEHGVILGEVEIESTIDEAGVDGLTDEIERFLREQGEGG